MARCLILSSLLVLFATSLAAQTISCESPEGKYRECRAGSSGLAVLLWELSEGRCFEGTSWGTRSVGLIWVDRGCRALFTLRDSSTPGSRRVVCESQNGQRQLCAAELLRTGDPGRGVSLARQLGEVACLEGDTWAYDVERDQIWVDRGCRAEFVVGGRRDPNAAIERLDGVVVCESKDGRRAQCAAETAGGVRIIRALSAEECGYGRQWGFDAKIIWVTSGCRAEFAVRAQPKPVLNTVTCESYDTARVSCAADTRYGVAILRKLGGNYCVLGRTWNFDGSAIWVSDGCRAQFALGGYRLPETAVPPTASKMVCESTESFRKVCEADTSHGVGMVRQLSSSDCILNRTWGYSPAGIWVEGGCRAEFAVAR